MAITRLGLYGGPRAPYPGFVAAAANAVVSGTVVDGGVLESEIVAGGETIIITIANDTWVDATFDAQRQNILDGLDSDGVAVNGWNAEVRDKEDVTAVVRTSDTVVTITLSAAAGYSIDADETITVTVPASALTGAAELEASPTFDVTAEAEVARQAGGWVPPETIAKLRQLVRDARRDREDDSRSRRKRTERRIQELAEIYDNLTGVAPVSASPVIREAVEGFAASSDAPIPPMQAIDWTALLASMEAVERLSIAMLEAADMQAEEDEIVLLMMAS